MSSEVQTPNRRGLARVAMAVVAIFIAYNIFLLANSHLIRVNLIRIVEISDTAWLTEAPELVSGKFAFEEPAVLERYAPPVPLPLVDDGPPTVRAQQLFASLIDMVSQTDPGNQCWNSESPRRMTENLQKSNCRGFCSDYAILLATAAQKAGIPARRIVLESPDGMGGGNHVVTELWLDDMGQWVLFDLHLFNVVRDDTGRYLSMLETRQLLLTGQRQRVVAEQLTAVGALMTPEEVLDYYTARAADAQYLASSNLFTDNNRSLIRRSISGAVQSLAPLGPAAMMPPRFLGRLLLTRTRYRILDDLNPVTYSPQAWFVGYRIALWIALLGLAVLAWVRVRSKSSK